MNQNLPMNSVAEILASIRQTLADAYTAVERGGDAGWLVQGAFVRMRIFLEAAGLHEALKAVQQIEALASKNWAETAFDEEAGDDYLVWGARLYQYLSAIETSLGKPNTSIVTKDLVQILRETQYFITDKNCFPHPPACEADVHVRIEAALRCMFPDLIHKPHVAKQIKQFQPDTGIPSISTLIEYKFMGSRGEERRIAEEILADSRGYFSERWEKCIYVVYETKRFEPENQWRQLLRESGIKEGTEIIVLSGETPKRGRRVPRRVRHESGKS